MIIRNLCQRDYIDAPINERTGLNEACVLACVQMICESRSGKTVDQNIFYGRAVESMAINADCYINSYDRLGVFFISAEWKEINWQFSKDLRDLKRQLAKNNPVVCYIGGHAVLAIDVIDDYAERPQFVTAIDPKYRDAKAVIKLNTSRIKRMGFYV